MWVGGRWIIEDCFLSLILYKYLAKKVNRAGQHFSPDEIIGTLQDMNFVRIEGECYIPTYTRTDLTNNLHGSAGFRTDTQIVSKQRMKTIITESKKVENHIKSLPYSYKVV